MDSEDVNHGGVCSGLCGTGVGQGRFSSTHNDVSASIDPSSGNIRFFFVFFCIGNSLKEHCNVALAYG